MKRPIPHERRFQAAFDGARSRLKSLPQDALPAEEALQMAAHLLNLLHRPHPCPFEGEAERLAAKLTSDLKACGCLLEVIEALARVLDLVTLWHFDQEERGAR